MTWFDAFDRWGHGVDARWETAIDQQIAPSITAVVMLGLDLGLPLCGLVALGYLLL